MGFSCRFMRLLVIFWQIAEECFPAHAPAPVIPGVESERFQDRVQGRGVPWLSWN
jgi:hypothetical protein